MTPQSNLEKFITEAEERLKAATPGPWVPFGWSGQCHLNHAHGLGSCKYDYAPQTWHGAHHTISLASEPVAVVITTEEYGALSKPDAELIAAAPTDIAKLIAIVKVLTQTVQEAKTHLVPDLVEPGRTVFWKQVQALAQANAIAGGEVV